MMIAWLLFPVICALLCGGCGQLCLALMRLERPGSLVLPFGFAAIVVVAGLTTAISALAPITVPLVSVIAAAGLAQWALRRRLRSLLDPWAVAVAVVVLFAYGAPAILSGSATFAGYLKLDDTSTWLSIADRVATHGRSLAGLPPSTYALNLHYYLSSLGYPIGSFLPLAIAKAFVPVDAAWVFQPFLAFCAAMVGLVVYSVLSPIIARRWLRALVACECAQPALLYGYSQWGESRRSLGRCCCSSWASWRGGPNRGRPHAGHR